MSGRDRAPVAPLAACRPVSPDAVVTVTSATCERVLGVEWRVLRDHCLRVGVPIGRIGRWPTVRLDRLFAASGLAHAETAPESSPRLAEWSEDEAVARLARRGGAR